MKIEDYLRIWGSKKNEKRRISHFYNSTTSSNNLKSLHSTNKFNLENEDFWNSFFNPQK